MKVLFTYFCLHILRVSQQEPGAEFFFLSAHARFFCDFYFVGTRAAEMITVEIRPASEIVGVACISVYPVLPLVYVKIVL